MIKTRCDQCLIILALINLIQPNTSNPLTTLRPFRELAHDLRSGPIDVLDNKTFRIADLHYDGRGPDAYFWVGRGVPSENGTKVPYGDGDKLPAYAGETVTVTLPENVTIADIDYLAMWCVQYKHNFGHVFMNESLRQWRLEKSNNFLQPLRQLAYFLQSGPIEIVNNKTLRVTSFYYDGTAPEAHFWVGKGMPSKNGTLVPDENNSTRSLSAYNGNNVTIYLPGNITVDDVDYLAVWNDGDEHNFGHVFFEETLGPDDNTINLTSDLKGVPLEEFSRLKHGLRSDRILLIDERTFFIPNLHYDGEGPDAHFWVGNGTEPSPSGVEVPEGSVRTKTLPKYDGQSVYVRLPENLTVRNIEYLGVWCIQYEQNFGHISIPRNLGGLPRMRRYPNITDDGRKIVRIPKCCDHDMIVDTSGCVPKNVPFNVSIDVHMSNDTHLNDVPMSRNRIVYVPYVQNINCPKYPLEPDRDNYSLLTSGNMLYISEKKKLSLDEYCVDTLEMEVGKFITTPFVCAVFDEAPRIYLLYAICIFISCVFLMITSSVYIVIKKIRDTRGLCIIGYSTSMAVSFFCLGITQVVGAEQTCNVLGYIFQFTIVSTFTWFTTVCYETWYLTKYFRDDSIEQLARNRRLTYLGLAMVIPLVFFVASIIYDVVPLMPTNYLESTCRFTSDIHKKLFLFIPVVSSIVINIIILVWTGMLVSENNKLQGSSLDVWTYMQTDLRWKFRGCIFLVILMTLCWFAEVVTYLFEHPVTFLDIIHSLQGVMVCVILLSTNPPRKDISRYFSNKCGRRGQQRQRDDMRNGQLYDDEVKNRTAVELRPLGNFTN